MKINLERVGKRRNDLRKGGEYLGVCRVFQTMEQVADWFLVAHDGSSHGVHRRPAEAGAAEMIAAAAVGKFPAAKGAKRGVQIRDQEQAIGTNCLPGVGKTSSAEGAAAGKDQFGKARTPFFPGNHQGYQAKKDEKGGN